MQPRSSPLSHGLRRLRLERRISIATLARLARVPARRLRAFETVASALEPDEIDRLAEVLTVTPEEMAAHERSLTAALMEQSARERETSRRLCEAVRELLDEAQVLLEQIEDTRRRHRQ